MHCRRCDFNKDSHLDVIVCYFLNDIIDILFLVLLMVHFQLKPFYPRVLQPGRVPGTRPDPDMGPGTNSPGRAGCRVLTCRVGSGAGYEKNFRVGSGSHHIPGPDPATSQHFEN